MKMKKWMKVTLWALLGVFVALLIAVATLPWWIFPVARGSANLVAPMIVKTNFHLGDLGFEYGEGRFHLGDLHLGNPKGYIYSHADTNAVDFGGLEVRIDMDTITSNVIHIISIDITNLTVRTDLVGKNFKMIAANATGEDEEEVEAKADAEVAEAEKVETEKAEGAEAKEGEAVDAEDNEEIKVIIDRFTVDGLEINLGLGDMPLPKIEFTDIGKDSGGCTIGETYDQIAGAIDSAIGPVVKSVKIGAALSGDGVGAAVNAVKSIGGMFKKSEEKK